jgi:predicted branched-subunit amino acid permease
MSLLVFGASAQFGATAVLAGGGGPAAAVAAGSLLNSRFVPMALAAGPWLSRRPGRRLLEGLAVNDASWALAHLGDGRFDRRIMIGATLIQYPAWVGGTAIGAFAGDVVADPAALGLDAVFPAFFLVLLVDSIGGRPDAARAIAGAAITLALLSFVSVGVAVLAAAAPAAWALRR